jgi:peptidyl-prolyl cis-trans isomerase SurA
MKPRFLSFAILLSLMVAAPVIADTVVEEIIARVNNDIITSSEFQRSRNQMLNEAKEKFGAQADQVVKSKEKDVLRDMIDQALLVQKGKDLGITGDTDLIKRLDEMRKQMNLEAVEDSGNGQTSLQKAAEQQGVDWEDFKQNMKNQIVTQQVIGHDVGSRLQITDGEVKQYYNDHQKEFDQPEQVRLSEILVAPTPPINADTNTKKEEIPPTPEQLTAAEQKAGDLMAQIKGGAKFEDVARKSSDGPTAAQGGDLGYFKRGMLAKELEEKTFSLKPGDVTDVIRTRQGFILLKVTEHNDAGMIPLKQVEPQIQETLYLEKIQPALRAYLTKLREDAYIDIKPGYIDSGASPNQTKPIMTAPNPEADKQASASKKKKKKMGIF